MQGPNPLLDAGFPFRLRVMVAGKERKGVVRGNDYIVPLRAGEVYTLEIESRDTPRPGVAAAVGGRVEH